MGDVVPIFPAPIETRAQLLVVLFFYPILLIIFVLLVDIFFLDKEFFTLINIILIVLSVILIIGYILTRIYSKNRK